MMDAVLTLILVVVAALVTHFLVRTVQTPPSTAPARDEAATRAREVDELLSAKETELPAKPADPVPLLRDIDEREADALKRIDSATSLGDFRFKERGTP